jgi:6-pyruvoyltetrahydropterin/6-carboxytetrahydropterin synthase
MLSVTKIFTFEAAHAISDYDGACKNIHGHSYKLHVTVTSKKDLTNSMVIDFKQLKKIVQQAILNDYDHALILKINKLNLTATQVIGTKLLWFDEEPTAEQILLDMAKKLQSNIPNNVVLKELKLHETETCFATWQNDI